MLPRPLLLCSTALLTITLSTQTLAAPLPDDHLRDLRAEVLARINESRAAEGLPEIIAHEGIERVAQAHAEDSATHFNSENPETREQSYLGHVSSDGRALNARYRDMGVDTGAFFAENAGYWIRSPFGEVREAVRFGLRTIHEGMMAEVPPNDGHREAILGPYTHVGIGIALLAEEPAEGNAIFLITDFSYYSKEEAGASGMPKERLPAARSIPRLPIPTHGGPFLDIPPDHPQAQAILRMKEEELIHGYPDGTFQAERAVNRAEMLKMLLDVAHFSPIGREFNQCFKDVFSQWFAPYVCVAKREGWVTGFPDETFRPDQAVTRAEAVTLAARVFSILVRENVPLPFDDVPAHTWFTDSARSVASFALPPFVGSHFLPNRPMQRGEVAEMLASLLEETAP